MGVQVVDEARERLKLVPPTEPAEPKPPVHNHYAWPAKEMLAVFATLGYILAARFVLLLAAIGGFFLTYLVVAHPSTGGIVASIGYDICVFLPTVALALRKG